MSQVAVTIAATVACLLLGLLAVLQVLVASGRPYGRLVWGGGHRVLPRHLRFASIASVALYAAFGALILSRAGVLPGGQTPLVAVATWVLFGYFALGILMNAISRSAAERAVMTPICAVLAGASLVVALA